MNRGWRNKARRYAQRHHFFWLPCPLCGEPFGGQEWGGAGIPTDQPGTSQGICAHCAGTRLNAAERRLRDMGVTIHVSASDSTGAMVHHKIGGDKVVSPDRFAAAYGDLPSDGEG